ncbi:hypothetical protein SKAU_G00262430 [Synaphobranchus kaupii]|uniref:Uncharacterized protein n=1 Tax=Synaphobranchus kaupii TaxID=118154 RepID=A0A9Q1IPT9_SYNKA|nr:hypothetical protein SKAU_G00262430 [Synaphobranchus kaupii]
MSENSTTPLTRETPSCVWLLQRDQSPLFFPAVRVQAAEQYPRVNVRSYGPMQSDPPLRITRASIQCRTQRIRETVGGWTGVALSNIHKTT